ncbi:carboxypeptidase-like regulatory domain-containing protein [Aquimarina sp. 2201CG14-23]|uniref:carboxypeptidase-like regulatory domain-containing protein n=1 Tax=Aquimarina mycalae TaxID=3040073 RepID=UPI002477ECED|nr:carboxypeptidase-like regulatory domain-containing protein [Aquimarina sp. 2201CG14-23]MDH7447381.1 carboxypeptidase-like regulatory domain-containing protein [Aquimarina sp. 2201CG14-23]
MKLTYFLLLTFLLLITAPIYAQKTKVSLDLENSTVEQVLTTIESSTKFKFLYNVKNIALSRKTSIIVKNEPIEAVLSKLFKGTAIVFEVYEDQIVLSKKKNKAIVAPKQIEQKEEITGQAIEINSGFPIVFATIKLKNSTVGTISDENGFFRIPKRYKQQNDTLLVSSIGYKTRVIPLSNLKDTEINIIKLLPKIEALEEVMLIAKKNAPTKYIAPEKIVEKAIQKIWDNYPITPFSYIGYYRDYQLANKRYINLNEGIIEVYDAGFLTDKIHYSNNQTVIYNYKQNKNFFRDSIMAVAYDNEKHKYIKDGEISPIGGNELSILNVSNIIRNYNKRAFSFVYILKENFLYNHEFRYAQKKYLDDIPLYEIKFYAKKDITGVKHAAEGIIYISPENYSIHKIIYSAFRIPQKEPVFSVNIEYAPKGDRMFLNYISFNNHFEVRSKKSFVMNDITFDQAENAFFLTFNNEINEASIQNKKNFRFIYQNRKLNIKQITLKTPKVIKVDIVKGSIKNVDQLVKSEMSDFKYKIKNITDIANRKLGKPSTTKVKQFRELFVQEVFPNKKYSDAPKYARKSVPLSQSPINTLEDESRYWVNTPLKTIKE